MTDPRKLTAEELEKALHSDFREEAIMRHCIALESELAQVRGELSKAYDLYREALIKQGTMSDDHFVREIVAERDAARLEAGRLQARLAVAVEALEQAHRRFEAIDDWQPKSSVYCQGCYGETKAMGYAGSAEVSTALAKIKETK